MAKKDKQDESIQILEVRDKRKSIYIHFTKGTDDYPVTFHDNPLPSFYKALEALAEHVVALCELPAKDAGKVKATGITVRYKGDAMTALIVARKSIRKGKRVFNITTPLLPVYESEENPEADHLDEAEAKAIEKVIREAEKYIAGERAQGQIKFEDEPAPEPKKAPGDNTEQFPALTEKPAGT